MTITQTPSPNQSSRGGVKITKIVIHWWGDPSQNPTINGVTNYLRKSSSRVSAHYVVSENQVNQLVSETMKAWHAGNCNSSSIGIEVNPNTSEQTYKTVGALVADIRVRWGNLPLVKHSSCNATQCPGTVDLNKINSYANSGGDTMDTNAGKELYRTGLFREAESEGAAAQWNGRTPASALKVIRNTTEWNHYANKVKDYDRVLHVANSRGDELGVLQKVLIEKDKQIKQLANAADLDDIEDAKVLAALEKSQAKVIELEKTQGGFTEGDRETLNSTRKLVGSIWGLVMNLFKRSK